jgi:hypothetical protein
VGSREYGRHVEKLNVKKEVKLANGHRNREGKAPRNIKLGIRGGERSARSYVCHFPEKKLGIRR